MSASIEEMCQAEDCVPIPSAKGGLPTTWRIAEIVTMPAIRHRSQTLLPIASWYWSCQGKHIVVKHWLEQHTYIEKRQSKISSNSMSFSPLWPASPLPGSQGRAHGLHTPLLCSRTLTPPPSSLKYWKLGVCLRATDAHT